MNTSIPAVTAALLTLAPAGAFAHETAADALHREIVVTADPAEPGPPSRPATTVTLDAETIRTRINAVSVEDTLKYLPSLVIRKRHAGDNFAPIATRTSGLGASARSLIYADGALLSALIANNNGNGSPRWTLVTPAEIDSVSVQYGPFSAAYPGNAIGTVVTITTRMPEALELRAGTLSSVQQFDLYGTHRNLPTWQVSGSVGDRVGPLALLLAATRTLAHGQPISIVTVPGTTQPAGTRGGLAGLNRVGQPIRLLGASGIERHDQATYKLKAALTLAPGIRLAYTLGIWTDATSAEVQSYQTTPAGAPSYATAGSGATTGFNAGLYRRAALHLSQALGLTGQAPGLDWQVIATSYRYARDWQTNPSPDAASATSPATGFIAIRNDLPGALAGGPGTIQRQDGTGWVTLDSSARLALAAGQELSLGAHADRETLDAATYALANWRDAGSALGQLRSRSFGNTRTLALWAQHTIRFVPAATLTLGGRQEWWRAWGGLNATLTATLRDTLRQPERTFAGFSPKASLEWHGAGGWSARLSAAQAWRMPTVGELYQTVTIGTLLANPNPGLQPERARSAELALEHRDRHGTARVSLFNEVIDGALISQLSAATGASFVQNVDRTRARGVELALDRRDVVPGLDLAASLTWADAITSRNAALPAAEGKLLPSVPRWKGNAVLTWRATPKVSLTGAVRFTSRNYGSLTNDDIVGQTFQGFYKYTVIDLRAQFKPTEQITFAAGVDNLNNNSYFLFHPFPQRTVFVQMDWKL